MINWNYNFKRYFLVSSNILVKPENMSLIRELQFNNHKTVPSNLTDTTEIMLGRHTGVQEFLFYFRINEVLFTPTHALFHTTMYQSFKLY